MTSYNDNVYLYWNIFRISCKIFLNSDFPFTFFIIINTFHKDQIFIALKLGIIDHLVPLPEVREAAIAFAGEIAENAPLALLSLRQQMRGDLAEIVQAATDIEGSEQFLLQQTADYREGVKAVAERRPGNYQNR